jgi:hypothetical protein
MLNWRLLSTCFLIIRWTVPVPVTHVTVTETPETKKPKRCTIPFYTLVRTTKKLHPRHQDQGPRPSLPLWRPPSPGLQKRPVHTLPPSRHCRVDATVNWTLNGVRVVGIHLNERASERATTCMEAGYLPTKTG